MAAVAAIGSFAASYHGGVGASADELKARGLDALRAIAARVAPTTPKPAPSRADAEDGSAAAVDPEPASTPAEAGTEPPPPSHRPRRRNRPGRHRPYRPPPPA